MILFTILLLTLIILVTIMVVVVSIFGAGAIVKLGDVIVCVVFITLIIKALIKRRRK